jgi:hypothetical protein
LKTYRLLLLGMITRINFSTMTRKFSLTETGITEKFVVASAMLLMAMSIARKDCVHTELMFWTLALTYL